MHPCVSECACTRVCAYPCVHVCECACACVCARTRMCACLCARTCVCARVCMCALLHALECVRLSVHTHVTVCAHLSGHTCMCMSVHTLKCVHVHFVHGCECAHSCVCLCVHTLECAPESVRALTRRGTDCQASLGGLPGVCGAGWLGMGAPSERDQAGSRCLRQVRRDGQRVLASALVEAGDRVRKCGLSRVAGTLCWCAGKAVVGDQLSRSEEAVEAPNSPVPFLGTTIK